MRFFAIDDILCFYKRRLCSQFYDRNKKRVFIFVCVLYEVSCLLAGLRGVGGSVIAAEVAAVEITAVLFGELAAVGAAGVGDARPEKI